MKIKITSYKNIIDESQENCTFIPNSVFELIDDVFAFKIYCYLCRKNGQEISFKTMAEDCGMAKSTIQKAIKYLEDNNLIIKNNKGITNIYTVNYYEKEKIVNNEDENMPTLKDMIGEEEYNKLQKEKAFEYEFKKEKTCSTQKHRSNTHKDTRWRKHVLERDNHTCKMCGKTDCDLHVHHIKRYVDHEELRTDINNGISLCIECHRKITGHEEEYEDFFINIIIKDILERFYK